MRLWGAISQSGLEAILREVAKIGARFEMTSNGHLLDWSNRSKLLGKDITLGHLHLTRPQMPVIAVFGRGSCQRAGFQRASSVNNPCVSST